MSKFIKYMDQPVNGKYWQMSKRQVKNNSDDLVELDMIQK